MQKLVILLTLVSCVGCVVREVREHHIVYAEETTHDEEVYL